MLELNKVYNGDCVEGMKLIDDNSIQLIVTSPPYADMRNYGKFKGIKPDDYVEWFLPKAKEIHRIIKQDGSFILNINDKVVNGFKHPYVFDLVCELHKIGFKMWERFIWYKRNPMPGMGGKRFRDGIEYIFWLSKDKPYVDIESVKVPKKDTKDRSSDSNFIESRSGHNKKRRETSTPFPDLVVPINVLEINLGNTYKVAGNHIAIYPEQLPKFFIKCGSKENDIVLDPFAGSGTTLKVAKDLNRQYIGFELNNEYINIIEKRLN